jgi:RHS repeat-associated protein
VRSSGLPGTLLEEYAYDGNGNRQKAVSSYPGAVPLNAELGTSIGCPDASGTAANAEDQLCKYGDYDYVYNARGQLQSKSDGSVTTSYTYDGLGRLLGLTEPGMDLHYVLDALGRRIGKIRDGNLEKGWLYADALNPIAELDSAGNVRATFIYGTRAHVPDAMVLTDGTVYRFITDHLGSVRLVVNAETGEVAERMDYDAFGRVLSDTHPGFQPFGFAGGLYDDDTGLVRFGARDYDAYAGRWTAKDPVLFGGGDGNLYAYAKLDPVNFLDPSGLFPLSKCAKDRLSPYFPDLDLDDVDLQLGVPWPVQVVMGGDVNAFTLGNTVYVDPAAYDESSAAGLGLIGHELEHVRQFQRAGGVVSFGGDYIGEYISNRRAGQNHDDAYRNIPYEGEARRTGRKVVNGLTNDFGTEVCGGCN